MKPSSFFKKIILLGLFIIPASVSLPAQAQNGRQNGAAITADYPYFKNNTGQAVNGICIELPEGNKIISFKTTGADGKTMSFELLFDTYEASVPGWLCFKFKSPVNNNSTIQSELEKNDKRNLEKKPIRFFLTNNAIQVGPIQQISFFAYGTLKYG